MSLEKWHLLQEKTSALTLRERGILTGVSVVVILFIWAQFVFLSYEEKEKKYTAKVAEQRQGVLAKSDRLLVLTNMLANDPNAPLKAKRESLQAEMAELMADIEGRLNNLVAPEKMADLMREVLADYKGLRLIRAKNLPVEPIRIESDTPSNDTNNKPQAGLQTVLFAHGFEMVLSGEYFQTLAFLKHLEEMKGFYWQALNYKVDVYPQAEITIKISTLSLEEGWIGV